MIPGESNAYCYTMGTGTGPLYVNNESVDELEHDMKDSTDMITKLQVEKVREIINAEMSPVIGNEVAFRHKFVHMPSWTGTDEEGNEVKV